jgi:hypothetical protein
MNSLKKTARTAGLWYLIAAITGGFGLMYVPSVIIEPGNATVTANNIISSELLYRFGIASNLICQIAFIFQVLTLYLLLREVNKKQATLMVALVIVSIPIAFLNELNRIAPLILMSGADFLKVFNQNQLQAFVMASIDLYNWGISIVEIFWGLWLFPFGFLVYKSGFIPKIFGILLIVACFGYVIESFTFLLFPEKQESIAIFTMVFGVVGEFSIILWLLIKGVNEQKIVSQKIFSNAT